MYDNEGNRTWSCELDSFGRVRKFTGNLCDCPFRYQGQYEDEETGLYYNRFRYYSPETGGYISQDPIRLNGGFNLYTYVYDTNGWIDPYGLDWNYVLVNADGNVYYHGRSSDNASLSDVGKRHAGTTNEVGDIVRFGDGDTLVRVTDPKTDYDIVRGIEQRGIEQSWGSYRKEQ